VLVAFSLRSAVASLSPILAEIGADFTVPSWILGLIGAAPPICFAVFGIVTPALERRFGLERLAAAAMIVAAAAMIGRALASDALLLLLGTAVLFAAIGVGNVVLPPLIKKYFPDRSGSMTALYSALLAVAAFVPPLVAVPVADAAGWRFSLGLWAVFALAAIVPWVAMVVRAPRQARGPVGESRGTEAGDEVDEPAPQVLGRLARVPLAWALAVTFAISSASVYVCFAWLPVVLVDVAGVDHAAAGALLSLFGAMGLPWSVLVPMAATPVEPHRRRLRGRPRRGSLRGCGARAGSDGGDRAVGRASRRAAGALPRRARAHPAPFAHARGRCGALELHAERRLCDRGAVPARVRGAAREHGRVDGSADAPRCAVPVHDPRGVRRDSHGHGRRRVAAANRPHLVSGRRGSSPR